MSANRDFDVIVVGGGHAGVEAALAAARAGAAVALAVLDPESLGRMSCNPAIGGIAKGQLVREVDALGGIMGLCADAAGIQFRMLNTRKGPAVRSPRAQCDRELYGREVVARVQNQSGVQVLTGEVVDLQTAAGPAGGRRVEGVVLADGTSARAPSVVLTTGTFLGGKLFHGDWQEPGGRMGERGATRLSRALEALDLRLGCHKTGTPPRLARDSIDWGRLQEQPGDAVPRPFSFRTERLPDRQLSCWVTRTNPATHEVIAQNAHRSPMVRGAIQGRGPRYCPSVEDKILRFPDKDEHLIFLEPEGWDSEEIYPNGLSTSLPVEVQEQFLRRIEGLEQVEILRPGYAVEYDHLCTDQIRADLQVAGVAGLFAAGQINGTSGYEEAAAQGLVAGVNAQRFARGEGPFVLDRASSYIGVMIDDLCRVNPDEPYRMFTSRAEFRLQLRSDNADRRLTPRAVELGLLDESDGERVAQKERAIADGLALLRGRRRDGKTAEELLRRPEVLLDDLLDWLPELRAESADVRSELEAEVKYAGYIRRQQSAVERMQRMDGKKIPSSFDYDGLRGLSSEARERLNQRQPLTLGEASRLEGVTPSDLQLVLTMLR